MNNDKGENKVNVNNENNKSDNERLTAIKKIRKIIYFKAFGIILFIIYQYALTPLIFLVNLIFLSNSVIDDKTGKSISNENIYKIIGWFLIFLFPLWSVISIGIEITVNQIFLFEKLWTFLVMILESIVDIPLTFLLGHNLFSMFLYSETNYCQLLNPWLVFFPTKYHKSGFQLFKNFILSFYFTIIGGILYSEIKGNKYEVFITSIILTMIILNILKLIGVIVLIILRISYHDINDKPKQELEDDVKNKDDKIKKID